MISFNVNGKEYKVKFGYGVLCETDILDRITNLSRENLTFSTTMSVLPELLLAGLQKKHPDEFGYETESEKKVAMKKVYDLLDDYEDESTEEKPKNGYILYDQLQDELMSNGFLSGMQSKVAEKVAQETDATKIPQDHKKA